MADIKDVKVTISGVSMNGETYLKLLRLIKKHEPEIWDEIKDTVFDSLDSAVVKADASGNGLHIQNVSNRYYDYDGDCCTCKRPMATPPQRLRKGQLNKCGICRKPFKRQIKV